MNGNLFLRQNLRYSTIISLRPRLKSVGFHDRILTRMTFPSGTIVINSFLLGVNSFMGKKQFTVILAAGILMSCAFYRPSADEITFEETESVGQEYASGNEESIDLLSSGGLFEVVSETQSRKGQTLEELLPQPQISSVPSTPPSSSLTVKTLEAYPDPSDAVTDYAREYRDADRRYRSDTLFYTCTKKETQGGFYYLTHVIIRNADQICGDDSFGDFAGTRETPADAADRTGAKILINGSYFKYETGFATGGELLIRDNKAVHGPWSDGYEICLRKDGTLFSPGYNTIDSVLAQDVVFSWGTCEDLLIRDGEKCALTDYDWNGFSYPRTAIGMVRPLEYYIITAGGADYSGGITIYEEQEIFSKLGCTYARGLDGGGSSALVVEGEYVNENGDRAEDGTLMRRPVADFLFFRE